MCPHQLSGESSPVVAREHHVDGHAPSQGARLASWWRLDPPLPVGEGEVNERGITVALEPNGVEIAVLLLWAVGLVCAVARLRRERSVSSWTCLLYTSDAADE